MFFCNLTKLLLSVECGIIHNNYGMSRQFFHKKLFKPHFKQLAIHSTVILERRENLFTHLCSHNANPAVFSARYMSDDLFATPCITMFSAKVGINPCFVNIDNLVFWNFSNRGKIQGYFFRGLFFVSLYLFLRV